MVQAIGIIDNYGCVPLVRQVFSHAMFQPLMGRRGDPDVIQEGLAAAIPVLRRLDGIICEGLILNGTLSLADLHLAPMFAYYDMAPEGREAMQRYDGLAHWWMRTKVLKNLRDTDAFSANAHQ